MLYISPLKALAYDVDRNLRAPLTGIRAQASKLDVATTDIDVAMRTGDTPQSERQAMLRNPPDLLITTPESLYLMLTSRAREILATVETVIIDEIHALAGTKRGAHLALSLERLDAITARRPNASGCRRRSAPRTIASSSGADVATSDTWTPRPSRSSMHPRTRRLDIEIVVPVGT